MTLASLLLLLFRFCLLSGIRGALLLQVCFSQCTPGRLPVSYVCVCQKRSQAVPYLRCWARAHLSLYRLLHGVPYKTIYRCQAPSVRFFLFLFLLFHFSTSTVSTLDVSRTKRRRLLFIDKATTFDILVSEKRVGVCRQSRQKRMSAYGHSAVLDSIGLHTQEAAEGEDFGVSALGR